MSKQVLVAALRPTDGGVRRMVDFACGLLEARTYHPVLAYYEPYSMSPELSAPLFALPFRRPKARQETIDGRPAWAIGAWLPELEFTQYWPTRPWRRAIDSCRHHLVVSGNCLAATALVATGTPFLGWIATAWEGDRRDRVSQFRWVRRELDRRVNAPRLRRLEREILSGGGFLALSRYTQAELQTLNGGRHVGLLPMPIDETLFTPAPGEVRPGRIAFVGRLDDPRKNSRLLVEAVALLRRRGVDVELVMAGCEPGGPVERELRARGNGHFRALPQLPQREVASLLRTVDVFVVPSHQEGLCIAALEAMASGCPVISTRCGGPEEFVRDGETGFLVDATADSMAARIEQVVTDRRLRKELSAGSRLLVEQTYSLPQAAALFWRAFEERFSTI